MAAGDFEQQFNRNKKGNKQQGSNAPVIGVNRQ
jgi:hypothetical protein